tara:strand:- start:238 stop:459 length:222 start_codon:yes stop_codon:yes gene_type:complete
MNVKMQPTNSYILHANPGPLSFTVGDWNDAEGFYAAVPCRKGLAVINQANVLKICRTTQSAMKYIEKHQKRRK